MTDAPSLSTDQKQAAPTETPDQTTKVLEAFCTVAQRFEKDLRQVGVLEASHLLSTARQAAEERLQEHQKSRQKIAASNAQVESL